MSCAGCACRRTRMPLRGGRIGVLQATIRPNARGISEVKLSHTLRATSAAFDDPNLVSTGGLVPVLALAESAGLRDLADQHLSVPTDKGANAGLKVASLVGGMVAGADSIDDMALLRHGGMGRVFARAYAPSTLGSFLRAFTFGHVRQLDAVASWFLIAMAGLTRLLGVGTGPAAGTDEAVASEGYALLDVDDTIIEVHGHWAAPLNRARCSIRGSRVDPKVLKQREYLLGTTSASSLVYRSLDRWRRQMVEQGAGLLERTIRLVTETRERIDGIEGLRLMGDEVVGPGMAYELDPLVLIIDVRDLGISGFQAAELARARHHVDFGASDTHRVSARLTHSDDQQTAGILVKTLEALIQDAERAEKPYPVQLPSADALEMETVMTPREAFFATAEQVPAAQAVGRIAAEMVSPYPPGVPVLAPGRITSEVLDYLVTGVRAGMLIPDAADPELKGVRVVAT